MEKLCLYNFHLKMILMTHSHHKWNKMIHLQLNLNDTVSFSRFYCALFYFRYAKIYKNKY